MFKRLFIAVILLGSMSANAANPISELDFGTYELGRVDRQLTGMQMRLSKANGTWLMEGREGGSWENISCDRGCDYRLSTTKESAMYLNSFPVEVQTQFNIACIQNVANAFCRLNQKTESSKGFYALVTLVAGRPIPILLKKIAKP